MVFGRMSLLKLVAASLMLGATPAGASDDVRALVGRWEASDTRGSRAPYPFKARRAADVSDAAVLDAPSIDGVWILGARSTKGESAWRFIVRQHGADVSATILRVDGDTGTVSGSYRDGRFVLSHFSGARPMLLEVTPIADGNLKVKQNGKTELLAARPDTTRAREIGTPTDPDGHTSVTDPAEPLRFSASDLAGRVVTNTDRQFRDKVVLVNISGSWCPNCHDEAPFLAALYRKYRSRGLEVVTLSFEEKDQLENPTRLRAFIEQYGIGYTVLLAGEPDQVNEKLPQAVNLNAFPTTFLLGRDGRVRGVHAGFPSPGSGEFYTRAERDITSRIETLLAEQPKRPRAELTPVAGASARAGGKVVVTLKVKLPPDVHVQANKPRDPALIPTVLTIDAPEGVSVEKITYPAPSDFMQAGQSKPLAVLGPEFSVDVQLALGAASTGVLTIPARLRYQACDATLCYVPVTATTQWTVKVER
jgi:thiol-disulfide isomerase/thioredoxin